jgi:FtsZ-binding cell division protein ZapB
MLMRKITHFILILKLLKMKFTTLKQKHQAIAQRFYDLRQLGLTITETNERLRAEFFLNTNSAIVAARKRYLPDIEREHQVAQNV